MFNYLVETKNEYTNHLCNIISPFIYEGFKKMYNDIAFPKGLPPNQELEREEILCFFQKCLKQCKNWNTILIGHQTIIENETNRILTETSKQGYVYLEDLIKASLKANLLILMYNPSCKEQIQIDSSYYNNKLHTFFYILYIEFAKELWCNPYLMYHNFSPIDIKKNQRECIGLIKECIIETIKKILPIKQILCNYLKEDIIINQPSHESIPKIKDNLDLVVNPGGDLVDNIKNILHNQISTNTEKPIQKDLEIITTIHSDSTSINNLLKTDQNELQIDNKKVDDENDSNTSNYESDSNNDKESLSNIKIPEKCENSHEQNVKNILKDLNEVNNKDQISDTSISSKNKYNYKEIFGNSK
jgi:hypothetical protein